MMLDDKEIIKVTNRDNGSVGYLIPDMSNLKRNFESGETKKITMEELRKLSYVPGGMYILENYLILDNEAAVAELLNGVELEYYYNEEQIKELLNEGSLDELKDCLDFAPEGVINLVKEIAVKEDISDKRKIAAILASTGFNVEKAIEINKETVEEKKESKPTRRANAPETTVEPEIKTRRTQSNYKIVSK